MRRLIRTTVMAALLFVGLILAATGIGRLIYRPPAILTALGACEFTCWYGVVVGQTYLTTADTGLRAVGFDAYPQFANVLSYTGDGNECHRILLLFSRNRVTNIHVRECAEEVRVGDLMLALGPPESLLTAGYDAWLVWAGGYLDARVKGAASPFSTVRAFGANLPVIDVAFGSHWRGFIPFWRYCALTGQRLYCVAATGST